MPVLEYQVSVPSTIVWRDHEKKIFGMQLLHLEDFHIDGGITDEGLACGVAPNIGYRGYVELADIGRLNIKPSHFICVDSAVVYGFADKQAEIGRLARNARFAKVEECGSFFRNRTGGWVHKNCLQLIERKSDV
jgi:hypothetical protein